MQKNIQDHLIRQREVIRCRLKKLNGKQNEIKVSQNYQIKSSTGGLNIQQKHSNII